ncbi:MAG TPA: peptide ABC transporter substrate-binding protein [Chloroflexota bacterium]|nr:peptide ABC transporter substrate-binding protein [Chloroflexota bacterium]
MKPLNIGLFDEPPALGSKFSGGGTGRADYSFLFAAKLIQYDSHGSPMAVLATEPPSLEKGTWRLLDDQRMETTYTLRKATFQDGSPFTADDVAFTWRLIMNPDLPAEDHEPEKFIDSIEVLDPQTFVVHWRETYVFANAWDLEPLPKAIFGPLVDRDVQAFTNTSAWTRDWVGLGPYRVTDWVQGTYLKGQAFDGFVLGKPKIRDIVVNFVQDANQAVSRMLAGTLDITLGNLIRGDEGLVLKEQMEARGDGSVLTIPTKIRYGELQYREPRPPPSRDVRVRQSLLHALDRAQLVEALLHGLSTMADMYLAPNDAAFPAADKVIAKYPYDPNRAATLLQDAGWTRGDEGVLRNSTGERFDLELRTTEETQNQKEVQIIADAWKAVGINPSVEIVPKAKQNDQEYRAKYPGIGFSATSIQADWLSKWQTELIASEANRWRGGNRGAYSRPEFDAMYRQYITTVDPVERQAVLVALVKFASEDVTYLPLYYQIDVHAIRAGLKGVEPRWPGQPGMAFNAYQWYWAG